MGGTNILFGSRNLMSAGKVDAQDAPKSAHGGRAIELQEWISATPSCIKRRGTVIGGYMASQRTEK